MEDYLSTHLAGLVQTMKSLLLRIDNLEDLVRGQNKKILELQTSTVRDTFMSRPSLQRPPHSQTAGSSGRNTTEGFQVVGIERDFFNLLPEIPVQPPNRTDKEDDLLSLRVEDFEKQEVEMCDSVV